LFCKKNCFVQIKKHLFTWKEYPFDIQKKTDHLFNGDITTHKRHLMNIQKKKKEQGDFMSFNPLGISKVECIFYFPDTKEKCHLQVKRI
jgi:hypothetical protein